MGFPVFRFEKWGSSGFRFPGTGIPISLFPGSIPYRFSFPFFLIFRFRVHMVFPVFAIGFPVPELGFRFPKLFAGFLNWGFRFPELFPVSGFSVSDMSRNGFSDFDLPVFWFTGRMGSPNWFSGFPVITQWVLVGSVAQVLLVDTPNNLF